MLKNVRTVDNKNAGQMNATDITKYWRQQTEESWQNKEEEEEM